MRAANLNLRWIPRRSQVTQVPKFDLCVNRQG
jgi:hypothetical protein